MKSKHQKINPNVSIIESSFLFSNDGDHDEDRLEEKMSKGEIKGGFFFNIFLVSLIMVIFLEFEETSKKKGILSQGEEVSE